MTAIVADLHAVWAWVLLHPVQVLIYVWMAFNVIWAQCPQPKNPTLAKLWNFTHAFLQLVVTHASEPGTFKLPWLLQAAVSILSSSEIKPPAINVGSGGDPTTTANNAGDSHDVKSG